MKESIGSTASLNIIITFIAIVFAFLAATLSYYKAYKVNNIIVNSIEKFEGLNSLSVNEINTKLDSLGYQRYNFECSESISHGNLTYKLVSTDTNNINGVCIYEHRYYGDGSSVSPELYNHDQYLAITYMTINLPVIQDFIKIPIKTSTDTIFRCYGGNCVGKGE